MRSLHALLAAALTVAPAAAFAQGNVSLFGIVDVPVTYGAGSQASLTSVGGAGGGSLAGSRLGLQGKEDLGGGLTARFLIEHGLLPDTGAQGSAQSFWNRQAWLSLVSPVGEVLAGRMYTPTFLVHGTYDPFGPQGVAAQQVLYGSLEMAQPANLRASNAISYLTPTSMKSVVVHAMVSAGEGAPGAYRGLRVGVTEGGLSADAAVAAYSQASLPTKAGPVALGTLHTFTMGTRYKQGGWSVFGLYDQARGDALKTRGAQIGLSYVAGSTEFKASMAQSQLRHGNGTRLGTTSRLGFGAVHSLSPRMALYSSVARLSNAHGASMTVAGGSTAANKPARGMDLGLRHTF